MAVTPSISLYVPCYNQEAFIGRTLEGILSQSLSPEEVFVIDDGSTDRSVEIVRRYPVALIRHDRNRGLAAARNTAFRHARNELVAALDADCVPSPTWLERMAMCLENSQIAGVAGHLVESFQEEAPDRWRAYHMRLHWGDTPLHNPPYLVGCNTLFRREAVLRAGPWDERFITNGEDTYITARLYELGYSLVYEPSAIAYHQRRDTVASVLQGYWRYNRDNYNPINWGRFWKSCRRTVLQLAPYEVRQDLRNKRFGLLWLTALMPLYVPYCEFRHLMRAQRQQNKAAET